MNGVIVIVIVRTNKEIQEAGYLFTGKHDDNGKSIYQGSIINADGYKSDVDNNHFHCVEYKDGNFTSDIYGDADHLHMYESIEVVGHVLDFVEVYNSGEWCGNLGAGFKSDNDFGFYDSATCEAVTTEGRKQLRHLIDVVWNHITESKEVPATRTADKLINEAFNIK